MAPFFRAYTLPRQLLEGDNGGGQQMPAGQFRDIARIRINIGRNGHDLRFAIVNSGDFGGSFARFNDLARLSLHSSR